MGGMVFTPAVRQIYISALADVLHRHDLSHMSFSLLFPSLARYSFTELIEVSGKYLKTSGLLIPDGRQIPS